MMLLQFLGMLLLGALGGLIYLIARDIWSGYAEARHEERRQGEILALRRRYVELSPDDPGAQERLGDALRSNGFPEEALEAYRVAESLIANRPPSDLLTSAAGTGLETRIRLACLDISERDAPEAHGQTMRTRQQVCRQCGYLAGYADRDCPTCGAPLPVDSPLDAIRHEGIRTAIGRETVRFSLKVALAVLSLGIALAIPDPILKFAVLIAAVIVLAGLFLRRLGNPTLGD